MVKLSFPIAFLAAGLLVARSALGSQAGHLDLQTKAQHARHALRQLSPEEVDTYAAAEKAPAGSDRVAEADSGADKEMNAPLGFKRVRNPKCPGVKTPPIGKPLLDKMKANLAAKGWDSWVSGTRMQTLLELDTPAMAVYSRRYLPNVVKGRLVNREVNEIAKYWLDKLAPDAPAMVVDGGAAGDTASVGVGFVNAAKSAEPAADRKRYALYASRENDYLLNEGKRVNGAISHRPPREPAQLWSDFVYMVPPHFAYYGVINDNFTIAREAYEQIKAYRSVLRDSETGLWKHITNNGGWEDSNLWGTGIAWVAAGISRVYATYRYSPYAGRLQSEMNELAGWGNEVLAASFAYQNRTSGLLPNAYNPGANSSWDDSASSALLASTVFRFGQIGILCDRTRMLNKADRVRRGVQSILNGKTGWIPAADPLKWYSLTNESPESMAFILLMEAAARDYRKESHC